ncbi:MAG: acetylglutamate kinase, partial [Opitutales bacterium]|nr:acetylglutamate kinase [Opitutales bacterium]
MEEHIKSSSEKAGVLIEALPYIKKFQGETFVVKYGGAFMDDPNPELRMRVAQDISLLAAVGINVVVVHGGGKAISRAMASSGLNVEFKNGMRVTDDAAVKIVENVLNKEVNGEICSLLKSCHSSPFSIAGNKVFKCKKHLSRDANGEEIDLGYVGKISEVDSDIINGILLQGKIPVISPIAIGEADNHAYNTNADVAAAAVAAALKARRLVFLCDIAGLLRDPKDPTTLISTLYVDEVEGLKKSGVIGGGMLPKVDSSVAAISAGVRRVHFIDGYMPHSLLLEIFTDKGIGTEIT